MSGDLPSAALERSFLRFRQNNFDKNTDGKTFIINEFGRLTFFCLKANWLIINKHFMLLNAITINNFT